MKHSKVTFIGCGNMGQSLIGGLIADGLPADCITAADPDHAARRQTALNHEIEVLENNQQAARDAEVVVLAVKPPTVKPVLQDLRSALRRKPLIFSIVAGITLARLDEWSGGDLAIVRAMPNTPALVQAGITALCANPHTTAAERDLAEALARSVGTALWFTDEALLDTVTALSGSGPAYFFLVMEMMEQAAITLGLPRDQARILTLHTAFGAAKLALESQYDTATLRRHVTSPRGTTEQALKVLLDGDIETLFLHALKAAQERSVELATSLGGD